MTNRTSACAGVPRIRSAAAWIFIACLLLPLGIRAQGSPLAGKIVQLRVKLPLETITVVGSYKSRNFDLPMDDSIKLSLEFIGSMSD